MLGTTAYTLAPDWLKGTPEWKEVQAGEIDQTLEDQGLPKPALSYTEATTWGPEGDPSSRPNNKLETRRMGLRKIPRNSID